MKLVISGGQLSKLKKNQAFQLSKTQLQGQPKKGAQYEVDLDDSHARKVKTAMRKGKGYRVKGGSIFSSISKGVSKAAKTVSDGVSKTASKAVKYVEDDLADDVADTYGEVNQLALKADIGGGVEQAKKVVPKSVARSAFAAALMAGGVDETSANVMAGAAVESAYSVDFSRSLKGQGKKAGIGAGKGAISEGLSANKSKPTTKGDGVKGINHLGHDYAKNAFKGTSVSFAPQSNAIRNTTMPIKIPKQSAVSKKKNDQMVDTNTASGGSFKEVGSGFSVKAKVKIPKGFGGNGVKQPAKGSQAAKDKMAALRNMRKKKTSAGSMKPL
jgi:hypothetical protein